MSQCFDYHTIKYLQEMSIFLDNVPNSLMFLPRNKMTTISMLKTGYNVSFELHLVMNFHKEPVS